ncbi:MAG: A/G-specific adenine glycosylase [Treponema sp.]|jgi:A/G-specific adenine glycosylase|nr:A/G-specific adenine glycosylase [Treponema sp.]
MDTAEFRKIIYSYYKEAGRVFPWRTDCSPWGVMVSELMLQQTQTERVEPYWKRWIDKWPKPENLAGAGLEEVLQEWSGLGYNRRARYLRDCAKIITGNHGGKVPESPAELAKLPGIGPYTAGAIACFAYNYPSVFIETNIRAVILHFYFKDKENVTDREIMPILEETLDTENPRVWYWALMDYGASLKKLTANPNRRSRHYAKQSPFEGSFRQLRGSIIRSLVSAGPGAAEELQNRIDRETESEELYRALETLEKELMVAEEGGIYRIRE